VRSQPIDITRVIRKMRGGTQSHLVEASDGCFYVAKFAGNPLGNRTLLNEWIGHHLLQSVSASTPPVKLLRLSQQIIDEQDPHFEIGTHRVPVRAGMHFGSRCPVNPDETAIFDFLPRKLLPCVANIEDFAKAFVIDKLLGQVDTRQAFFVRKRACGNGDVAFRAHLIDQGGLFGQTRWRFEDAPLHGLFHDKHIYSLIVMRRACLETIELLRKFDESQLYGWMRSVPTEWFADGDQGHLTGLLSKLISRIENIDSIIWWQLDQLLKDRELLSCALAPTDKQPVEFGSPQKTNAPGSIALGCQ
jgi:hypothetical protein